jgi:hypothetical protein
MMYAGEQLQHNKKLPQLAVDNSVHNIFCAEEFPEILLYAGVQYIKQQLYTIYCIL